MASPLAIHGMEISHDTALIIIIIAQSIWTLILLPISIYYCYQLWTLYKQNIPFITKRRPIMVIFSVALTNFYMVIVRAITDLCHLLEWGEDHTFHELEQFLAYTLYLGTNVIIFRVWFLYYDFHYEAGLLSVQWKKHILRQRDYKPWALRHRWMGNCKVIVTATIVFWAIAVCCSMIGSKIIWTEEHATNWLTIPSLIFLPLALIFMGCGIREYKDAFYLKRELKLSGYAFCVSSVIWVIWLNIAYPDWNITLVVGNILVGYASCAIVAISTWWVIKMYRNELLREIPEDVKRLPLKQILATKTGFKLFADHLVKELSIEHLFFLYEIMQIKQELMHQKVLVNENIGRFFNMDYNNKRKKYKQFNPKRIKRKLQNIIETYIDFNGDHGINISSLTRVKIMEILDELHEDELRMTADLAYVATVSNSVFVNYTSDTEYTTDKSQGTTDKSQPADIELPPRDNSLAVNVAAAITMSEAMPNRSRTATPADSINNTPATGGSPMVTFADPVVSPPIGSLTRSMTPKEIVDDGSSLRQCTGVKLRRETSNYSTTYNRSLDVISDHPSCNGIGNEEEKEIIVGYMDKLNDAVNEVVRLLKGDSLRRFYDSDEYQRMVGDIDDDERRHKHKDRNVLLMES